MALNSEKIKLALTDDHNLFRKGLIKLINLKNEDEKYTILFEADGGEQLKQLIDPENLPDIMLMDIAMPLTEDGFAAVSWVRKTHPGVDILVISMIETEEAIVRMLRMGVKGYLSKDIEVGDLHAALEQIYSKGHYYTDFLTGKLVHALNNDGTFKPEQLNATPEEDPELKLLTKNEVEFLKLSATEQTYQQVAEIMGLSHKTVDGYRDALFKKLKITSRVGLALFAVKHGLVKL
jgi:two-component system, NarL family, invasion response regulator UvrY